MPATIVPSLPFVFRSTEHMRRVLDGPIGSEILASMDSRRLIGLCFYDMGARSFYSRKEPIRSVDDMKGLAVRVQPSDISVETFRAMGARPVAVPFDRVDGSAEGRRGRRLREQLAGLRQRRPRSRRAVLTA